MQHETRSQKLISFEGSWNNRKTEQDSRHVSPHTTFEVLSSFLCSHFQVQALEHQHILSADLFWPWLLPWLYPGDEAKTLGDDMWVLISYSFPFLANVLFIMCIILSTSFSFFLLLLTLS